MSVGVRDDWLDQILNRIYKDQECSYFFKRWIDSRYNRRWSPIYITRRIFWRRWRRVWQSPPMMTNNKIINLKNLAPRYDCLLPCFVFFVIFYHITVERATSSNCSVLAFQRLRKILFQTSCTSIPSYCLSQTWLSYYLIISQYDGLRALIIKETINNN